MQEEKQQGYPILHILKFRFCDTAFTGYIPWKIHDEAMQITPKLVSWHQFCGSIKAKPNTHFYHPKRKVYTYFGFGKKVKMYGIKTFNGMKHLHHI
jgi:hypothetical protein